MRLCGDCVHLEACLAFYHSEISFMSEDYDRKEFVKKEACGRFKSTADVVEIVRCKDCKFNVANMEKDEMCINDYSGEDIVCSYFMTDGLEPKDYCSRGERRSENEG